MHWMVFFFIGLFVGANVGVVSAGMLFQAKNRCKVPNIIEYEAPRNSGTRRAVPANLQI